MDSKPSQIPVLMSNRTSLSLNPGVLQQSTNTVNSQTLERAPSPLLTKNGKRLSLLNGSTGSNGMRKSSGDFEDPAQLKAHISKLESALQAAHARMAEDCRGAGIDASISLSTPVSGSPLPWTPTHGTLDLPELGFTPGNDESLDEVREEPMKRLPKSNSNYDLRTAAATPRDGRGISQIPRASVQNAISLHPSPKASSPLASPLLADSPGSNGRFSPSLHPSGLRKVSSSNNTASTRVIDGLQTELLNVKGHLERVKQDLRSAGRVSSSLTRQNEDLKETKDRLRQEIEASAGALQRRERMLQDVLERARKAEAEAESYASNQKDLEKSTKKSLAEMKAQVEEARRKEAKANSECTALRNGVKGMKESWARDLKGIRAEMKAADEKWKTEGEGMRTKNAALVKLTQDQAAERTSILALVDTAAKQQDAARQALVGEVEQLRAQVDASAAETTRATEIANELQAELTRIRRFMREPCDSQELPSDVNAGQS